MEHHILEQQNMESLKKLSETNMEISKAKNALVALKSEEAAYISEREAKTLERIQKLFDDSEDLLKKTQANYTELDELLTSAKGLASFVIEAQGTFSKMVSDFKERDELWQKKVEKKEKELATLTQKILADNVKIKNDRESIESAKKELAKDKLRIADSWAEIAREIKRLNN